MKETKTGLSVLLVEPPPQTMKSGPLRRTRRSYPLNSLSRRYLVTLAAILLLGLMFFSGMVGLIAAAQTSEGDTLPIIESAESLFKAMKAKNYPAIWSALTTKSRRTIAEDKKKEQDRRGNHYTIDFVMKDFDTNGVLSRDYWDEFLRYFNPDMALGDSTWRIGYVKKDTAEVVLQHKKSEKPANLKMFKENSQWKVGLTETFWSRK